MRKKRKHYPTQPNLFQLVVTPPWQLLPPEVQQRVLVLLVQLFREARSGRGPSQGKEGDNE